MSISVRSQIGKRSMCVCWKRERGSDNADSVRSGEGDPHQLLPPVSPPDIDPRSSTQI